MGRRLLFLVALIAVLVCSSFYSDRVFAQPFPNLEGKIMGMVSDASTFQPIDNAIITVGIGSFVNQTVTSNSTGLYSIRGLEGSLTGVTYNVTALKTGYLTSSKNVTLTVEIDFLPPADQNFYLTPNPTVTPTPPVPELSVETLLLTIATLTLLLGIVFVKKRRLAH